MFGQNNNQQQGSGFSGFGSSNTGGFGQSSNTSSGFGGGTGNTSAFGGFGSGSSGFGANNNTNTGNSLFGQQNKPAFGASSTSGGLFGGTPATSSAAFSGFGNTTASNNTASGGIFGSGSKPAFGGGTSTGSIFGGSNPPNAFGSSNNQPSNSFGSPFGQNNAVCEGTGSTPFQPFTEKEGTTNVMNHFQSVSFMAPYRNWSFEELRLADYNQGRHFGNASGQAGAFGTTNFGGFGGQQQQNSTGGGFGQQQNTTSGGLFGSNTSTSSPFGNNQSSGFGGNTSGGGLFGQQQPQQQQPKPGGLFGSTTSSSAATTGGLFGTSNNTSTPFGANTQSGGFGSTNAAGGGLFGQNNSQPQSKPFAFGSSNTNAGGGGFGSSNTGFGSNANSTSGGGLFGSQNNNSNTFGQQSTNQSNPFGGFGQQNQNPNQSNSSNLFGSGQGQQNQEQKPGGLFGNTTNNTTTGGGLFGNQNNNQTGGGLFGQSNTNQTNTGSLFDSKTNTGGGLFGSNNTNQNNAGGGLFGSNQNQNQNQPNQGSNLFGNLNNQQQKPGGLFGNTNTNAAAGGSGGLFGNNPSTTTNNQPGNSLFGFGNQTQQQQPQASGGLFGTSTNNNAGSSLFGNSSQQQQPTQQNQFQPAQSLQTSIIDPNAFGSPSIFSGLPPPPQVSGPIATPISQKSKQKKSSLVPYYKMTPTRSSNFQTPNRGYGFTYSTYGSPNSVSSVGSTPGGLNSSLLSGSVSRNLGKSLSTSNLRGSFRNAENVLTPGAFSTGGSRYGGPGSMKKLTIDRSLRTDLFGDRSTSAALPTPDKDRQSNSLKKRVSFDANTVGGNSQQSTETPTNGASNGEVSSSATPSAKEQGLLRSPRQQLKAKKSGNFGVLDHEAVQGNELAIVPEDRSPESIDAPSNRLALPHSQEDQPPGPYWMNPAREEIEQMSREERKHLSNFSVGRQGCGKVEFNKPVDISIHNLNDIFEGIVKIRIRSITVYPDTLKKPKQGQGLNVPSTIYLENSWPRQRDKKTLVYEKSGPRFNKHVERLKKLSGTSFVDYQKDSGTWIFTVPHFTTYGFDYEDDDDSEGESLHLSNSLLTNPPETPTPVNRATVSKSVSLTTEVRNNTTGLNGVSLNATPEASQRDIGRRAVVPGSFDEDAGLPEDSSDQEMTEIQDPPPLSPSASSEADAEDMDDRSEDPREQDVIEPHTVIERDIEMVGAFPAQEEDLPKAIMDGPVMSFTNDWTQMLLHTVQTGNRDRGALRKEQVRDDEGKRDARQIATRRRSGLPTSIDLMNSLFGQSLGSKRGTEAKVSRKGGLKV